jgi:outer membrane protein, multidrug efflux system
MNTTMKAAVLLALAGCTVGPDYEKPDVKAPETWSQASGDKLSTERADLARWWSAFGDPTLDSLVRRALQENLDLQAATSRVVEARAQAGHTRADWYPQAEGSSSYSRTRFSKNGPFPVPGSPERNLWSSGFDAGWEIDVFGGTRRAVEAADAEVEASVEDRRAVLVSLLGEVARAYVELRGAQRLEAILSGNISAARSTLEITRTRLQAGMATELDVSRAEAQLANTEALLPEARRTIRVSIHRLGVLLGLDPGSLSSVLEKEAPIPAAPARILVGLPSDLVMRRPDLRRAERKLAAATARIGVAVAEFYPKFSITGAFGLESVDASDFAKAASKAWSVGPTVRWPIFQAGRLQANVEIQDARAEQARLVYKHSVLSAFEEVENALVGVLRQWDQHRSRETAAASGRRSVALASDLYRKGLTGFLDVLESERVLYEAEQRRVESEVAIAVNVVALYKALGGGWELEGRGAEGR